MVAAVKWFIAFVVGLVLVSQPVDCSRRSLDVSGYDDDDDDVSRHYGAVPRYSSAAGRRQSSVSRWWERVRPHRLHGSVHLSPGRGFHLDTAVSWNLDFDGKWWTRENVCIHINETSEELTNEDRRRLSYTHTCNETSYTQYTCTTVRTRGRRVTTTTSVYQCCHGYRRSHDYRTAGRCTEDNASGQRPTVVATLLSLGATEMLKTLNVTGLLQLLRAGNHTLFAPTNEAFASFTPRVVTDLMVVRASNEVMDRLSTELRDVTAGHVVRGHVFAADLHVGGQMRLRTAADSPRNIWLNKYDVPHKQLVTANCVPLIYADVLANNGVVHVVDSVLPPADQSLQQLILSRRELSTFSTMLQTLHLSNDHQYTVFAPSNLAFDRLLPSVRDKVLSQDGCGPDIMRQHVLPGIICSQSVSASRSVRLRNAAGHYLTLTRPHVTAAAAAAAALTGDEAGSGQTMRVEGVQSTQTDVVASNGVLHIIDQVLFYSSVDGLIGVLKRSGEASRFVTLMELTGMTHQLQRMHEFTVFLPSNDAIQAVAANLNDMSREELTELVRYHIVPSRVSGSQIRDNVRLTTLSSTDEQLRVKRYHSFPFGRQSRRTVQCAAVQRSDVNRASVCGGVGHVISQVMRPPAASVLDVLTADSEYSFLVELINIAGLTDALRQTDRPITFFAPTNQAFQMLSSNTVNRMMSDAVRARRVIRSHIIPEWLCCEGVFASRQLFQLAVREVNLDGWVVSLQRSGDTVTYGDVPVASCDHTANNGVVHRLNTFVPVVINRYVVAPASSRWSSAQALRTLLRYLHS